MTGTRVLKTDWRNEIVSSGVGQTIAIGRRIGALLQGGEVIGLVGSLGAGKTQLAKGLGLGLGVADEGNVNSPTFVLVNEYPGRMTVFHLDAYRVRDVREFRALGFEEMCSAQSVVMVEWADRVASVFGGETLWIELVVTGAERRALKMRTRSVRLARRLGGLEA